MGCGRRGVRTPAADSHLRRDGPGDANPWRYTGGQYYPSTGLYRFGVRYYDPTLDRFTQIDPQKHLMDLRQGNRYSCAGDSPDNNSDPSGRDDVSTALPANNGCVTVGRDVVPNCTPSTPGGYGPDTPYEEACLLGAGLGSPYALVYESPFGFYFNCAAG